MPEAKSNHAAAVDGDYAFITIVCVVFFVPITIALFYLAYRYKNKLYRAVVSGQNATCVIGRAPYSIAKILLVVLIRHLARRGLVDLDELLDALSE